MVHSRRSTRVNAFYRAVIDFITGALPYGAVVMAHVRGETDEVNGHSSKAWGLIFKLVMPFVVPMLTAVLTAAATGYVTLQVIQNELAHQAAAIADLKEKDREHDRQLWELLKDKLDRSSRR